LLGHSISSRLPSIKHLDFVLTVKPLRVSPAKPGAYQYLVMHSNSTEPVPVCSL